MPTGIRSTNFCNFLFNWRAGPYAARSHSLEYLDKKVERVSVKTKLSWEETGEILDYIETRKAKYYARALKTNRPQFIRKEKSDCARSVQFDPDGRIWIVQNRACKKDPILGTGGFKRVSRAFDLETETFYARSVMKRSSDPKSADTEIKFLRLFGDSTEGVVQTFSINRCYKGKKGVYKVAFIQKEYEADLGYVLDKSKHLSLKERLQIAVDLFTGLRNIHAKGVTHFDIKPNNVLLYVDAQQNVRAAITDFNLSSYSGEKLDGVKGTETYIAPEYTENNLERVTNKIDIYAAGVTLDYLFKGVEGPILKSQIQKMKDENPDNRPSAQQALDFFHSLTVADRS